VPQRVEHLRAQHPQRALLHPRQRHRARLRRAHVLHALETPAVLRARPDLARPEIPRVVDVLGKVARDVRLLQQQAHRVRELELAGEVRRLLARGGEQEREALADEPRDVVAVQVVVRDRLEVLGLFLVFGARDKVGHAAAHFFCDAEDGIPVGGRNEPELLDDHLVLDEQLSVFFWARLLEIPAGSPTVDVEVPQQGLLYSRRQSHVVFNGVESPQNQVK
jgi:hypothetical protein